MFNKVLDPDIPNPAAGSADGISERRRQETLIKTGALQNAIFNSANFSSIATDGEDADTLIKSADLSLYEAKHEGKNTYRISELTTPARQYAGLPGSVMK